MPRHRSRSGSREKRHRHRSRSPRRHGGVEEDRHHRRHHHRRRSSRSPPSRSHRSRSRSWSPYRRRRSSSSSQSEAEEVKFTAGPTNPEIIKLSETQNEFMSPEERSMAAVMGFSGFVSTKGKRVSTNQKSEAVNIHVKRKYRQYMNRRGGFNRPLDYVE